MSHRTDRPRKSHPSSALMIAPLFLSCATSPDGLPSDKNWPRARAEFVILGRALAAPTALHYREFDQRAQNRLAPMARLDQTAEFRLTMSITVFLLKPTLRAMSR